MSIWDDFDHPHLIELVQRDKPTINQSTGIVTPGSVSTVAITGNFDPDPLDEEDRRQVPGIIEDGDSILYTEAPLEKGWTVRVFFDSASIRYDEFRVKGIDNSYAWLHNQDGTDTRVAYILGRMTKE